MRARPISDSDLSDSTPSRVIAVDWSGRRGSDQARHTWLCEIVDTAVRRLECGHTRSELVDHLAEVAAGEPPVVIGLDFAFSMPEWYLRDRGISSGPELWETVAREELTPGMRELGLAAWMQEPDRPFWCTRRPGGLTPERAFRRTELETRAMGTQPKSVFQLVGGGQVGRGSLYGMQALHELERRGFSVWPFADADGPLVVEIFPRALTGAVVKSNPAARAAFLEQLELRPADRAAAEASEDAFDALLSALAMARAGDAFDRLRMEPRYALEGKIWAATRPG
jgi:hypothetical protein